MSPPVLFDLGEDVEVTLRTRVNLLDGHPDIEMVWTADGFLAIAHPPFGFDTAPVLLLTNAEHDALRVLFPEIL